MTVAEEVDEYERAKVHFRVEYVSLLLDASNDVLNATMAELKQISKELYEKYELSKQLVE